VEYEGTAVRMLGGLRESAHAGVRVKGPLRACLEDFGSLRTQG
jgi:hypothetical protein